MKKAILFLIGLIMLAGNVYAAGDLIVDGKLGLGTGTSAPGSKLDIQEGSVIIEKSSSYPSVNLKAHSDTLGDSPYVKFYRSGGTKASPSSVPGGATLSTIDVYGFGTADIRTGQIKMMVDGTVNNDIIPTRWIFSTMNDSGTLATRMTIKNNGNVGIGVSDPGDYKLNVNGDLYVTGTLYVDEIAGTSDAKYKENVLSIEKPLEKVLGLEGIVFAWKKEAFPERNFPGGRHYGVIAQQVENVITEVVRTNPEGDKSVAYTEFIPVLIEAIKEQQTQINALRAEIERLKQGR